MQNTSKILLVVATVIIASILCLCCACIALIMFGMSTPTYKATMTARAAATIKAARPTKTPQPTNTILPTDTLIPTSSPTLADSPTPTSTVLTFTPTRTLTSTKTLTPTRTITLTKTLTLTRTPTRTRTITPTRPPTLPPANTDIPSAFKLLSLISPVPVGGTTHAQIKTAPGTACYLSYSTPSGNDSTAQGLGATTASSSGICSWSWNIGPKTNPGNGTVAITANGLTQYFTIIIQ